MTITTMMLVALLQRQSRIAEQGYVNIVEKQLHTIQKIDT